MTLVEGIRSRRNGKEGFQTTNVSMDTGSVESSSVLRWEGLYEFGFLDKRIRWNVDT